MEPQFRFCTSADGTRIGFSTLGEGTGIPVIAMQAWAMTQETSWSRRAIRAFDRGLARDRCVIRFDRRGVGVSQRSVEDLSLDAHLADLRAVRQELRLEHFDLYGWSGDGSAVAAAYAALYPEDVRHLLLGAPYARGADVSSADQTRGLVELIRGNWSLATRAIADTVYWSGPVEAQREFATMLRQSMSPEVAARYIEFQATVDVSELLPRIQAPTLVVYRHADRFPPRRAAQAVTELIPNARFVAFEGDSPLTMDWEKALEITREFLGERPVVPAGGLVTILFTDLTSSTALTQRLGDAKAQELVRAHNAIVRDALKTHGGAEIKHTGDGIMASFPTASGALGCAVTIQRAVAERADPDLQVHIGLNAGEPVAEEGDLFGTAVQLARRICDHAETGKILASDVVRQLGAGKGFLFADVGDVVPKGFDEAVRLYEVRWRE